jgi:hypothetical protein
MKLKYALLGSLFLLITLVVTDSFIKNNIFSEQTKLEKYTKAVRYEQSNRNKQENSISSILKALMYFEDVKITSVLVTEDKTIKIEMRCNDINNLKSRVENIEKIDGFKGINELKIVCLENKNYDALLNISFAK